MVARIADTEPRRRRCKLPSGAAWAGVLVLTLAAVGARRLRARRQPLSPHAWGRGSTYLWRGQPVVFQRAGHGTPVVLLHSPSLGATADDWRALAEPLAREHEVLAPDLPGWGRSARQSLPPGPELYVSFLADFLREVVRRPAVVVGAGWSAAYAVAAAVEGGGAARGLVLVAPRGLRSRRRPPLPASPWIDRIARVPGLAWLAVALATGRGAVRRHLESLYVAPERVDAHLVEHRLEAARQPGASRALRAWLEGRLELDVSGLIRQVEVPVWLVWGGAAAATPPAATELWLRELPEARVEIFESSGELPHAEEPGVFLARLRQFLDEVVERP